MALLMVRKLSVRSIVDCLMAHCRLESNWVSVVSIMVENGLVVDFVDDWLVHDSLVYDGFVMDNSLVMHNWHDVVDDSLVHLMDVLNMVRSGLMNDGSVVVDWLIVVRVVVHGLLMGLVAMVISVGTLVMLDLVMSVSSLVMSVEWLVVHLMRAFVSVVTV